MLDVVDSRVKTDGNPDCVAATAATATAVVFIVNDGPRVCGVALALLPVVLIVGDWRECNLRCLCQYWLSCRYKASIAANVLELERPRSEPEPEEMRRYLELDCLG